MQGILVSLFAPWVLFVSIFALLSFRARFLYPTFCHVLALLALLGILAGLVYAGERRKKNAGDGTWYFFLFGACALAWILAFGLGNGNFYINTLDYYEFTNLNSYVSVDPFLSRGSMLMDAGRVVFTEDAFLDVRKSMGFKDVQTFCVAPIVSRNASRASPQTLDLWAVGKGCCSGSQADFHCPYFQDPTTHGGLRLLGDEDRPFYRLAVQQAEARYGLKAEHPVFFTWTHDPFAEVLELYQSAARWFLMGVFSHLLLQVFLVVVAAMVFARLGGEP